MTIYHFCKSGHPLIPSWCTLQQELIEKKPMTTINDIVLIYMEGSPLAFARIESIEPDHKRGWFHVKLLMLQVPLQVVTWILRDVYIDGEIFTMGGKEMRLEKVECPQEEWQMNAPPDQDRPLSQDDEKVPDAKAKVISLTDLKKK